MVFQNTHAGLVYDRKMRTQPTIIVPQHPFVKIVASDLRRRCGLPRRSVQPHRWIVATSGGADSVALLQTLAFLAGRRNWNLELAVGHVQHHLREEAERDAGFVADLALQLNLPFLRADLDLTHGHGNLEAHARLERYRALGTLADEFQASAIITAHHGDDQLETLLMRILRGSSVRGLGCIAWQRRLTRNSPVSLLRPMLGVNRQQVHRFLKDLNQSWCQDDSNQDLSRLRARLRHDVLPILHDVCSDAAAKSVATADHMRQVDRFIESQAAQHQINVVIQNQPTLMLKRTSARRMHQVVLTALLRRLLIQSGAQADKIGLRALQPMIRSIRDQKGGQRIFNLTDRLHIIVTRDTIEIATHTVSD